MNAPHHGSHGYGGYAPAFAPAPLDLYAIATQQAWRKLWVSIGLFFGGIVLSVVGLAAGFVVFFGLALVVAGIVAFFGALAALTDPTRALTNLAPSEVQRRQVLRAVEAELSDPRTTSTLRTLKGTALLGPTWIAYHDANALLVSRREDVLWFYLARRRSTQTLKVHLRSGAVIAIDYTPADHHLLGGLAYALPHAIAGYDARWAATPLPLLAQEVDRRRYYAA